MKNSKLRRVLMLAVCAVMLVCLSVGATLAYLTDTTGQITNTFSVGKVNFPPDDENLAGGLDEADVDQNGELEWTTPQEMQAKRVTANSYKLYPGHDYVKDPTIHIDRTSDDCWVFFTINKTDLSFTHTTTTGEGDDAVTTTVTKNDIQAGNKDTDSTWTYDTIEKQIAANDWLQLEDSNKNPVMKDGNKVYYYWTKVNGETTDSYSETPWWDVGNKYIDLKIFSGFSIGADLTEGDLPTSAEVTQLQIKIQAYAAQADGFETALAAWNACFATTSTPGGIGGE